MPQDFPMEASETLAFTPECLENLPSPPSFVLRACSSRDKRFHTRLNRELGITAHSSEAMRREIRAGLKALWTAEQFDEFMPRIEAYWAAADDFEMQVKAQPGLTFDFDPEEEQRINDLVDRVAKTWPRLGRMRADNAELSDMLMPLITAVVVQDWAGLKTHRELDRGYLTPDCAIRLLEDIEAFAEQHKVETGLASAQLFTQCLLRMHLDKEEEKNSASPSPSPTTQPASKEKTSEKDGSSPASDQTASDLPPTPASA